MSIVLLLLLALVLLQGTWPPPPDWLGDDQSMAVTLGGLALIWLVGCVYTYFVCWVLKKHPTERRQIVRRFRSFEKRHFIVLLGFFVVALYGLGWGSTIDDIFGRESAALPGAKLALMAPFLLALIGSWVCFYDVERTAHDLERPPIAENSFTPNASPGVPGEGREAATPNRSHGRLPPFLSRRAFVVLQMRFNLLLVVPLLILILAQETVFWLLPSRREDSVLLAFLTMGPMIGALLFFPWLLRVFLGLKPLPLGPLRDRLEATARRLNFRYTDILLWNTRGSMANAMVTGLVPWGRYIVLTDRLLCELSPEEVEAVLGHEIGHIKHHHMTFYLVFLLGSMLVMTALAEQWRPTIDHWLHGYDLYAAFPALLVVALYLFFVFGYVSRNCERQADIYGSRVVSSQVFISALEKVAVLNGIPREKPGLLSSWRHPSIARRVEFLMRLEQHPELESRFQRRVGLLKWSFSLGVTSVLLWMYGVSWLHFAPLSDSVK